MSDGLEFDITLEGSLEDMGYQLAGSIEFFEHPETGEGAYRALIYTTDREGNLEDDDHYTEGQQMVVIAQDLLEEYLTRTVH
jgi:hypothetical protein